MTAPLAASPLNPTGFGCVIEGPVPAARDGDVRELIDEHGFALLRGAGVGDPTEFRALAERIVGPSVAYRDASTPRLRVSGNVYTATEYPAGLDIAPHGEQSHSTTAPYYLAFYCERPADTGGESFLVDAAAWRARIPVASRQRLEAAGVCYVRNFYDWLAPSWRTAFSTDSPAEAEDRCAATGTSCAWTTEGLRTERTGPAAIDHPRTGQRLWFNQAHLFHPSSLDAETRAALAELYDADEFPRNARYGDGEPIPDEVMAEILAAAESLTFSLRQRAGDVFVVDNLRTAHGRRGFAGERRMYVLMSSPWQVCDG